MISMQLSQSTLNWSRSWLFYFYLVFFRGSLMKFSYLNQETQIRWKKLNNKINNKHNEENIEMNGNDKNHSSIGRFMRLPACNMSLRIGVSEWNIYLIVAHPPIFNVEQFLAHITNDFYCRVSSFSSHFHRSKRSSLFIGCILWMNRWVLLLRIMNSFIMSREFQQNIRRFQQVSWMKMWYFPILSIRIWFFEYLIAWITKYSSWSVVLSFDWKRNNSKNTSA